MKKIINISFIVFISLITLNLIFSLGGCNLPGLIFGDGSPDFIPTPTDSIPPQDTTINDSLPVTLPDTCTTLVHLSDTAFVVLVAPFDNTLVNPTFRFNGGNNNPMTYFNLVELMHDHYSLGYTYTYYQSTTAVCLIIDGTEDQLQFQGRVSVFDNNNTAVLMTAYKRGIYFRGALTPAQATMEAAKRKNILSVSNTNESSWTMEEKDKFNRACLHFQDCKAGETRYDFSNQIVTQSIRDSTALYHWSIFH